MKHYFLFISLMSCLLFVITEVNAQPPMVDIKGQIVDQNSQQPIEFATVMLISKRDNKIIKGTTSEAGGLFNMKARGKFFHLEISFIGFENKRIENIENTGKTIDLGTIELLENGAELDEVIVRAERSTTEFKLDKRVFNVGQDLSSTGASALEVLNNVPSVNVNIEGQISLRGSSGVQILINGKPSVLADEQGALGSITADMIKQVEVITNPSAKYDAEGTSGIINIVIKKEERKGANGSVTLNLGIPHNHSLGLSLNRRTEKFNLFSQLGVGYREIPTDLENINQDFINNTTLFSDGEEFRNEVFYNVILGTDYYINEKNIITLSGSFAYEIEDQPSSTQFELVDENEDLIRSWSREEITEATNPKYRYELQYKREFDDNEDHTLLFSALGNLFAKDQSSDFFNTPITGTIDVDQQQTETEFKEIQSTFKLDYTKPFSDQWTVETGAQYVINDVSNDYIVYDIIDGSSVVDPNFTNTFEYDQKVLGLYGTTAYENDIWGIKIGMRLEQTDLKTFLINTEEENDRKFTNLFPSFHSSYKMSERVSFQLGYSRRIRRPRLWDLNPFFNIRNNFNIRTGNPNLLPEFTDSYELTSIYIFDKLSMNFGVYYRYTTDVIERISSFENNVNTFSPENIGVNKATGIEWNGKYTVSRKLVFNGDINYNRFDRTGIYEGVNFDFNADQWSTKITSKIKFPKKLDVELTGRYESKEKTVQGQISDNISLNFGLRKKIWNGKGVISLSIRDVFASRVRESETIQENFYIYSRRQRGRFMSLGLSYGFGKGEAMEFRGRRR